MTPGFPAKINMPIISLPPTQFIVALLLLCCLGNKVQSRPFVIDLSANKTEDYGEYTFSTERDLNRFKVILSDLALLDKYDLWIKFESKNPDFALSLGKDFVTPKRLVKVEAKSGNSLFVMSHSLYNGLFSFMRESSSFSVELFSYGNSLNRLMNYRLVFMLTKLPKLLFNTRYYIYMDPMKKNMELMLEYDGSLEPKKLRFQIDALRKKPDFQVIGHLDYGDLSYQLNNVFSSVVGGVLMEPDVQLCKTGTCQAKLEVLSTKTKLIAVEARTSGLIERVSPVRTHGIYGRTTLNNKVCVYELPYEERFKKLDISVLLVPVLGTTELLANTKSLPRSVDKYQWRDQNPISKRLTIRRSVLQQMKSFADPLFIAVKSVDPSEFYLRVEAHRPGTGGRLQTGVSEFVKLKKQDKIAYNYVFETHESKNVNFEVRIDKIQGSAKLFLYPCKEDERCALNKETLKSRQLLPGSDTIGYSLVSYNQPCEVKGEQQVTKCRFLVVLSALENTSLELSVNEREHHRLLIPGHTTEVNLFSGQTSFFKLSNPFRKEQVNLIKLAVFSHYGTFEVSVSKTSKFPNSENASLIKSFKASHAHLDQLTQAVEITSENVEDGHLQGPLYIGVHATTTSSFALKYTNPAVTANTVHVLPEGVETKGQLADYEEVAYYAIKVDLQKVENEVVYIHLTPIQGVFQMFAGSDGRLPTLRNHQYFSEDNNLRLQLSGEGTEYILGLQAKRPVRDPEAPFPGAQFFVSFSTTDTVVRLQSGNLFKKFTKARNTVAIEISHEMSNLLVLKNSAPQESVTVCANFTTSESVHWTATDCQYTLMANQSALYFDTDTIYEKCDLAKRSKSATHCYLVLHINGRRDGHYGIGYTYNNHPFHLYEESTLTLPLPLRVDSNINFVFHLKEHKKVRLQFNFRNQAARLYNKLVSVDDYSDQLAVRFPNAENFDSNNQKSFGGQTDIIYEKSAIAAIKNNAVVLLSIRPINGKTVGEFYKTDACLSLRVVSKLRELPRSQVLREDFLSDQWTFFKLFVGPNVNKIRATVSSSSAVHIEARLAKGVTTEIDRTDATTAGFQFVELTVKDQDFQMSDKKVSAGHYTLAVKCSRNAHLSLFWNSEQEKDTVQLLANEPLSVFVTRERPVEFMFYLNSPANTHIESMNLYVQSSKKVSISMLTSDQQTFSDAPNKRRWKATVGDNGGITSIKIAEKEPGFCINCYYIGTIHSEQDGQVTITAQPLGPGNSITLTPGVTIPEQLQSNETLKFQIYNADRDILDITVNMMSGFVDAYLGLNDTVSETNYAEKHELATSLQNQKLIIIAPFKYGIQGPHTFYLLIKNNYDSGCSFSVTADKNSLPTPIQHGMTKLVRLAQGENSNFVYMPRDNDHVELVFELRQVFNSRFVDQALQLISEYLRVMHVDQQQLLQFPVDNLQKSWRGNKVYLSFDVPNAQISHFLVHVYNPVGSGVVGSLNLLNKGYKLLTYNERFVDTLKANNSIVYEAFGQPAKYLFVDLRLCHGDVKIDFFQTNFTNVDADKGAEFQHLKDANNFIHYIKLESNKVFLKLKNEGSERAVYQLNVFGEGEIDSNPFRKLVQGDGGKVHVEWDRSRVLFRPVNVNTQYTVKFWHRVDYTLYLTDNIKAMRYARNCGDFMLDQVISDKFEFHSFTSSVDSRQVANQKAKVDISFSNLKGRTKYFGVVVARVSLFTTDEGMLTPVRTETSFYDEFILSSPHLAIPIENIVTCLFTVVLLIIGCYLFKKCFSSELNYQRYFRDPNELFRSDEVQLNFSIDAILESYNSRDGNAEEESRGAGGLTELSTNN